MLCTLCFVKIWILSCNNQARVTHRINTGQGCAFVKWLAESKHGNFSIVGCRNQQQKIKCTSFPVFVWWKCLHNNWKPWMFVGTLSLNVLSAAPRNSTNSSFELFFKFPFPFFFLLFWCKFCQVGLLNTNIRQLERTWGLLWWVPRVSHGDIDLIRINTAWVYLNTLITGGLKWWLKQ